MPLVWKIRKTNILNFIINTLIYLLLNKKIRNFVFGA